MTASEIREYCRKWADDILVRDQIDGKWGTYSLNEMPQEIRQAWIDRWADEGFKPYRTLHTTKSKTANL